MSITDIRDSPPCTMKRSNDSLAIDISAKVFYRDGSIYWNGSISRKDLIGAEAGSISETDGYRYVKAGATRRRVGAHRVVFYMHHGYLPPVIDHINRNRSDNRIENLRDAISETNNQGNQSAQIGRSSCYKGVCWDAARGKWQAYIKRNGKRYYLGRFAGERDAAQAYNNKAIELFGAFSNLNSIEEKP